jgi:hypothetical protein
VTVIHDALLAPLQEHPVPAVTVTPPVPPTEVRLCDVGDALNVQPTPPCVTVIVVPATVNVPVRLTVDAFAATV